jgi:hypothetical protein
MKRRWLFPIAASLSMLLMASAAAEDLCTPIAPKKWEGTLKYGGGGWVGATTFEQGSCTWSGADALNEGDTIIWDVSGYGGVTASVTSKQANSAVHRGLQGYFFNDKCERGGAWGITEANTPYSVGIPEGAQWFVAYQEYGGFSTQVTLETAGRECEEVVAPKPPKKKKKPKRN